MTRSALAVLMLLLIPSAVVMPAGAEDVRANLFTDPTGDVQVQSADGSISQADPMSNDNLDLVGGGVWAEDDNIITFYLQLEALSESSQGAPFTDPDYTLDFRFHGQGYRIFVVTALGNPVNDAFGRDTTQAFLQKEVGPDRFQGITNVEATLDFAENVVLIEVPRDAIVDENQAPLARNATLTDVRATASALGFFGFPVSFDGSGSGPRVGSPRYYDQAPDTGLGGSYTMKTGEVRQRGALFAFSADPVRWTNGEATTLTFTMQLTNTGSKDIPVSVSTADTHPSWEVAFSDALTVPARSAVNATILVTIPFVHQHGFIDHFSAEFASADGEHLAAVPLGIYWAEVPQPAGHHDTVWFHSVKQEITPPFDTLFGGVHGWFSATEELDGDERLPIPAGFAMVPSPMTNNRGMAFWGFYLEPSLRMGLDFLLDEQGTAEISVNLQTPVLDPSLSVQVYYITERRLDTGDGPTAGNRNTFTERTLLAEGTTAPQSGAVSGNNLFEVPITALPEAEIVPYGGDGNLYIQILLDSTFLVGTGFVAGSSTAPTLDPITSKVQLPLEEYHDPVDLSFQTDGSLRIDVGSEGQDRRVNPGRTVVYTFDLSYDGASSAGFTAELTGSNLEWAEILGDLSFELVPGTNRALAVAVHAPDDARDGDSSDLTLRVTNNANAAIQAGINMRTVVTTSEDIPDEAGRGTDLDSELRTDKKSPGVGLVSLIALVAIAVAARKRLA